MAAAMSAGGSSAAHTANRDNVLRLFDEMRESGPEAAEAAPVPYLQLDETIACSRSLYQRFSHYMCIEYIIPAGTRNSGQQLGPSSVVGNLRRLLNVGKERFPSNGT